MVDTVEPVVGKTALDQAHRQIHIDILNSLSWIPSGYTPSAGAGLILDIAAGRAFLGGASADRDVASTETMVDATTNYVFIYIDDILNDGVVYFHVDQDDTAPTQGPSHKIATVTTSGGSITLVTDERRTIPELAGALTLGGNLIVASQIASVTGTDLVLVGSAGNIIVNDPLRPNADATLDLGLLAQRFRDIRLSRTLFIGDDAELSQAVANRLDLVSGVDFNLVAGDILLAAGRLVDGIDPSDHSGRHDAGGADTLVVDAAAGLGSLRTLGSGTQQAGQGSLLADHNARHEPGGADPMAVDQAVTIASLRTLGLGAAQAAQGSVFADHDARHEPGGADPMAVDAAVSVGSLRRLGTSSLRAAPGDHAHSVTKSFFLSAEDAYATIGSPSLTFVNSSPPRFRAWQMDEFTLEAIAWTFVVRQEWSGGGFHTAILYWVRPEVGLGGAVTFENQYAAVADSELLNAASQSSIFSSNVAVPTQWDLDMLAVGAITSGSLAINDVVEMEIIRDGASGGDTHQADILILGMRIDFVATI